MNLISDLKSFISTAPGNGLIGTCVVFAVKLVEEVREVVVLRRLYPASCVQPDVVPPSGHLRVKVKVHCRQLVGTRGASQGEICTEVSVVGRSDASRSDIGAIDRQEVVQAPAGSTKM